MQMEGTVSGATSGNLNPLVVPPSPTLIRAGAGAGKTTELINRILGQILYFQTNLNRDPRLVVTTFTRKATQEIRERLLSKAQEFGDPKVLRYVQTSPFLSISTIHASLQKYLGQYGNKLGLPPQFSMVDGPQLHRIEKRTLRNLLKDPQLSAAFTKITDEWDLEDFWAVYRKWVHVSMIRSDLRPQTKAELKSECDQFLAHLQQGRSKLAQELSTAEKLPPSWVQYQALLNEKTKSLEQEIELWARRPRAPAGKNVPTECSDLSKDLIEQAKQLSSWSFTFDFQNQHQQLVDQFLLVAQGLQKSVEQEKVKRGQISMADLETWTLRLAQQFPETAKAFSERWDFWMIDEYQDTSPIQVQILKSLIGNKPEFVVGDPQQSIYLFRGARSQVFHDKETEIAARGGEVLQKMVNYRTQPQLMGQLNEYLPNFSSQFQAMQVHPKPEPSKFLGPRLTFWKVNEETEDLAIPLAQRIKQLQAEGVSLGSICILTRSNSDVAQFSQSLQKMGLDINATRAVQPSETRELRDALSYLKFLVQPHDNFNLIELLRTPWFGVSDQQLFQVAQKGDASYWSRRALISDPSIERLESDLAQVHVVGVFQQWLNGLVRSGLLESCSSIDPSGLREANLWKLISQVRWEERTPGFSYLKFIDEKLAERVVGEQGEDNVPAVIEPSRVQLMTIHKSKGLEFDHVLLASCDKEPPSGQKDLPFWLDEKSGVFSLELKNRSLDKWFKTLHGERIKALTKIQSDQESERVLYVALTRAKESLTLISRKPSKNSWADRWPSWAEVQNLEPEIQTFEKSVGRQIPELQPMFTAEKMEKRQIEKVRTADNYFGLELIQTGVETHRWLEALQFRWDLDLPELHRLRETLAQVKVVDMKHLITRGFVEWGFVRKTDQGLTSGRIDLWGRDSVGSVWIVDYKTGSPQYREQALQQLKDYAHALIQLKQVHSTDKIYLFPLYLNDLLASQPEEFSLKDEPC